MADETVAVANVDAIDARADGPRAKLVPGSLGFTLTLSGAMATLALSIDTMLPAFDEIREHFGLTGNDPAVAKLVMAFLLGIGVGQIPAGILADRFGRREVLWGGCVLYMVGGLLTVCAPTLNWMIAARFIWGMGAAGPRVATMAIVRDSFRGEAMAKQMSSITAVFLIVPMIAPSIGAALLMIGPWQLTVWACLAIVVLVVLASLRLPATLPSEARRTISGSEILRGWKTVLSAPGTAGCILAATVLTAGFTSYISESENIWDEVFGQKKLFPLIFAVMSACMVTANLVLGRVVMRIGLRRMLTFLPGIAIAASIVLFALTATTGGRPPFLAFLPLLSLVMMSLQMVMVNANSQAMVPLGHVAGTAAALVGAVPQVFGALLGTWIDSFFDGTVGPLGLAFLVSSIAGALCIAWALRASRHIVPDFGVVHAVAGH